MRQNELKTGIDVEDENGNVVGKSRLASGYGITQVVISRITMAAPGMIVLPVIMERLERRSWFQRLSILHAPFQVMMVGCFVSWTIIWTDCVTDPNNIFSWSSWSRLLVGSSLSVRLSQPASSRNSSLSSIAKSKPTPKEKSLRKFTSTRACKTDLGSTINSKQLCWAQQ